MTSLKWLNKQQQVIYKSHFVDKLEFTPKEKNLLSTADQVVSTFDLD